MSRDGKLNMPTKSLELIFHSWMRQREHTGLLLPANLTHNCKRKHCKTSQKATLMNLRSVRTLPVGTSASFESFMGGKFFFFFGGFQTHRLTNRLSKEKVFVLFLPNIWFKADVLPPLINTWIIPRTRQLLIQQKHRSVVQAWKGRTLNQMHVSTWTSHDGI